MALLSKLKARLHIHWHNRVVTSNGYYEQRECRCGSKQVYQVW